MDSDPRIDPKVFKVSMARGRFPVEMNPYVARKIGQAVGQFKRAEAPSAARVAVGHNAWPYADDLKQAVLKGVTEAGMDGVDIGQVTQDVLIFALGMGGYDLGLLIGGDGCANELVSIKAFRGDGTPIGVNNGLDTIAHISRRTGEPKLGMFGRIHKKELSESYISYVAKFAHHLKSVRCVVDAGFGMAADVLPPLAEELPMDLRILKAPDPAAALASYDPFEFPIQARAQVLGEAVRSAGAQFGAIFDPVVERVAFVDDAGKLHRPDIVGVLLARELLRRSAGGTVLYDVRAGAAFREELKQTDCRTIRSPADYLCMRLTMAHKNVLFGVSGDGRFFFKDFFHADSAVIALLVLWSALSVDSRPMSEILAPVDRYAWSGERVYPFESAQEAREVLEGLKRTFSDARLDDLDGVTAAFHDWWVCVRFDDGRRALTAAIEARDDATLAEAVARVDAALGTPA